MTCTGPSCERPAVRAGYCWGHTRQRVEKRRLSPLRPRGQTPMDRLRAAALAYADADTDADFLRANERLRAAAYALSRMDSTPGATLPACASSSSSESSR